MALYTITVNADPQQPPSQVGDNTSTLTFGTSKSFVLTDFTDTTPPYQQIENFQPYNILIETLPSNGSLKLSGNTLSTNTAVNYLEILLGNLVYEQPGSHTGYTDTFTFKISSTNLPNQYSASVGTFTINAEADLNQAPISVADGSITGELSALFTLTEASFNLDQMVDPEGDAAYQVKITSLPTQGTLYNNGAEVVINSNNVLDVSDITNGLLTYQTENGQNIGDVTFEFEVSDTGSQQFKG